MNETHQIKETYTMQRESIVTSRWNPSSEQDQSSLIHANYSPFPTNDNQTYTSQIVINPKPTKFVNEKESYCSRCENMINEGKIQFNNRFYHSNCFKCSMCQRNLNDLKRNQFKLDDHGEPICSSCELLEAKICSVCHEMILDGTILIFDEKNYHSKCFSCSICRKSLIDEKNLRLNNNQVICFQCYHEDIAPKCEQCSQPISTGKMITFNEKKYHFHCFRCNQCNETMNDQDIPLVNSKHYCSQCYQKYFALQCDKCSKMIINEKWTNFKEKKYHLNCFRCDYCDEAIMGNEFQTTDKHIFCIQCFEKHFAPKCFQCSKIISNGRSINYRDNQYHPECFRCIQCDRMMTENKFHTQNSKPCCNQCYNEHFALKCYKCSEIILDRYTKFQDKPLHIQCFKCDKCHRIIDSGEKFYDGELGILCTTCVD